MLSQTLFLLLSSAGWKQKIFTENVNLTADFFKNHNYPNYKAALRNLTKDATEFIRGYRSTPEIAPDSLPILNSMRKGGLLLTAHYGNHEALGQWLCRLKIPLIASYQPQRPAIFDRILRKWRSVDNQSYAKILSPRQILRSIEQGKLFALLADQDYRQPNFTSGRFLGRDVHCNPLPNFILKYLPNTPIFFAHIHKEKNICQLRIQQASPSQVIYTEYHHWLESLILEDSNQWYGWFHRRFHSTINPQPCLHTFPTKFP
jgi:KDO2-lipid IV(A) lauroyltransferase